MTWQTLAPVTLNKPGDYVPIPLAGAGGRVPIEIPAFPANEAGLFEVGVYSLPPGPGASPGVVATPQTGLIGPYKRYFVFEVPPNTASPHLGVRLLQHSDLDNKAYEILARWQEPYGSGTGNGGGTPVPSGFVAAVSWAEIKASAIAEIAQGYATIESVATGLSEIQEAIDALSTNTATQQAIASLFTRVQALETSDPTQAQAIATLQQSLADVIAGNATDAELTAALAGIQGQLDALASDAELAAAIAPIQAALNGLGGTYATDSELAAAIATETAARNAAIQQLEDSMIGPLTQISASATNAIATVAIAAAPAGQRHVIETITASYSARPTGGAVGVTGLWSLPVTEAGPAPLTGLRIAGATAGGLTVTLAAGGAGVTGTLIVGYRTEAV